MTGEETKLSASHECANVFVEINRLMREPGIKVAMDIQESAGLGDLGVVILLSLGPL